MNKQKNLKQENLKESKPKIESLKEINLVINEEETNTLDVENTHIKALIKQDKKINLVIKPKGTIKIDVTLEKNSQATITTLNEEKTTLTFKAECKNNSNLNIINISTNNINTENTIRLKENSSCFLLNNYYTKEGETKIKDLVIHEEQNTTSKITSKGYLLNSKSNIKGLIQIFPEASNSQGNQESNILLEGKSYAVSIPDLEIKNNEVKCSHGSTITRIKDEDLFYFESRGITKKEGKHMLIKGHVLSNVPPEMSHAQNFIGDKI